MTPSSQTPPFRHKYNLSDYEEPSGNLPRQNFSNESFCPQAGPTTESNESFNKWSCTAGGNDFSDNINCSVSYASQGSSVPSTFKPSF